MAKVSIIVISNKMEQEKNNSFGTTFFDIQRLF
jgi:hypothetical protein